MTVSSIGTSYLPTPSNQKSARPTPAPSPTVNVAVTGSIDADGDHDGDTAANEAKGMDVRG